MFVRNSVQTEHIYDNRYNASLFVPDCSQQVLAGLNIIVGFDSLGRKPVNDAQNTPAQFCLSDDEAMEIGRLGKVLEEHFGKPQDVEWVAEEGVPLPESIVLLQTRPEVIAKTKPPVDKIVDLMLDRISKGVGFEGLDM